MVNREPDRGVTTATPLNVAYRIDRISRHLSGHWLDFGCADGGYDEEMLARGLDAVSGVDVEEDRIVEAKRRNLPNADYTVFDGGLRRFGVSTMVVGIKLAVRWPAVR
jgi:2-polyprenyl-3-methyl-5-hydroxy-6-metoxy-1,4-benzoquinol methylase